MAPVGAVILAHRADGAHVRGYNYLVRWTGYNAVIPHGKTGVYFNLSKCGDNLDIHMLSAVEKATRRRVVETGRPILHRAQWLAPLEDDLVLEFLAVTSWGNEKGNPTTLPNLPGIHLHGRPEWWMTTLSGRTGRPTLHPAMALADAIMACVAQDRGINVCPCFGAGWRPSQSELDGFFDQKTISDTHQAMQKIIDSSDKHFTGMKAPEVFASFFDVYSLGNL
ncbi:hypothetical protein [Acidocella facilis]|uniref:hypothetical protein n=1 Tax=Acidocella facilis TaxID=525 RepID=UPI001F3F0EC8|nr:hypothetical protein [Acidocella facilis]